MKDCKFLVDVLKLFVQQYALIDGGDVHDEIISSTGLFRYTWLLDVSTLLFLLLK